MIFAVPLPICSWWNRQERGSWGKATKSEPGLPTIIVFHGCLVHCDCGFCH